ncbi:NAD(P)H-binding protein [Haliangium ochraceum]|uniref:NmrA family protein n=1 Tax=Haliangium ochraceum (strain DSM 14365 / JCM 11303 / SMP-2) TaxID=502025 RepID=D0LKM4_HALO1|nr:NAD(P)H-binding protein [Haliangium ochraceum]ACY15072.1 NmrA family protein [Haliangium ochraceum DSM 14365]
MRITINTPNGTIGRALAELLLDAGAELSIIARSPDKAQDLVARGARLVPGSIDDEAVVDQALEGADALFWLTPPAPRPDYLHWAVTTGRQAAALAAKHGVGKVVVLSSVGAHNGAGTGPVSCLLPIEEAFADAVPHTVALRAGMFMENLLRSIDTIAQAGAIYMPIAADQPLPLVATRDIAKVAAEELLAGASGGHRVRGVHGPAAMSNAQATAVLAEVLERPVSYYAVTLEQAREAMAAAGMPEFAQELYLEMYRAIAEGRLDPAEPRTSETTTPTTMAEFAREVLAPAVASA